MAKINSWDALKKLRAGIRQEAEAAKDQTVVAVGTATCGLAAGAGAIVDILKKEIDKAGLSGVKLVNTGCYGFCYAEPMVEIRTEKGSIKYGPVDENLARDIVQKHLKNGEIIESAVIKQEVERV